MASANLKVEITKLEFRPTKKPARDKVRCSDRSYMAAGAAVHPTSVNPSIILCTQGSLDEAAGLVSIDARRPHTSRMILNNFLGKPFNSPCEIVSNPVDNAVYFTVSQQLVVLSRFTNSLHRILHMATIGASDLSQNYPQITYIASIPRQEIVGLSPAI